MTRRQLAAACLRGSVGLQLFVVGIDLAQRQWGLAGLTLALVAALVTASWIVDAGDAWLVARLGKAQAEETLAKLALKQWEHQIQQQTDWVARQQPSSKYSSSN